MKLRILNGVDRTVTPEDGGIVEVEGCTEIPASYPDLEYVRGFEAANHVNGGS
jgi:hypothetical protein